MNEKNTIDNLFKKTLDNKGLPYEEGQWAEMEQLISKEKTAAIAWYKWGALALLIGATALIFLLPKPNKTIEAHTEQQVSTTTVKQSELQSNTEVKEQNLIYSNKTESQYSANQANETHAAELQSEPAIEQDNKELVKSASLIPPLAEVEKEDHNEFADADFSILRLSLKSLTQFEFEQPNLTVGAKTKNSFKAKRKSFNLYVSPFLGIYQYQKSYNASSPLKEFESPINGTDFGIQLRLSKDQWGIISGLSSTQLIEQTNYVEQLRIASYDTSFVLAQRKFIKLSNGRYVARVEEQIDTSYTEKDTIMCPNCEARFSYISIPLNAYYEFRRDRIGLFTQAGLTFNFLRNSNGRYINSAANEDASIMDNPDAAKHTLSLNASIGVKYHLSRKINAHLSVGQSWNTNSMMNNYSQKAQLTQLRMGVEWLMF